MEIQVLLLKILISLKYHKKTTVNYFIIIFKKSSKKLLFIIKNLIKIGNYFELSYLMNEDKKLKIELFF